MPWAVHVQGRLPPRSIGKEQATISPNFVCKAAAASLRQTLPPPPAAPSCCQPRRDRRPALGLPWSHAPRCAVHTTTGAVRAAAAGRGRRGAAACRTGAVMSISSSHHGRCATLRAAAVGGRSTESPHLHECASLRLLHVCFDGSAQTKCVLAMGETSSKAEHLG